MHRIIRRVLIEVLARDFGAARLEEILATARIGDPEADTGGLQPGQATLDLLGAASRVAGADPQALLEAVGDHWVGTIARDHPGVLGASASALQGFLSGLDTLYAAALPEFPGISPPRFAAEDLGENLLFLHYHGGHGELEPLCIGCIRALARRYGISAFVETGRCPEDGHAVFVIAHPEAGAWTSPAAA